MTITELITKHLAENDAPVQLLHECVTDAKNVKAKGFGASRIPAHTKLTFSTLHMTANDLMYFTFPIDRLDHAADASRKPKYIGVVLWVPFDFYDEATRG